MKNDILGKDLSPLFKKKLFLFDMDGTIYLDGKLFDGILELFKWIKDNNGDYVFITNNSSRSTKDYVKRIRDLNIECDEHNFFTSTEASIYLINKEYKDSLVYAQGTKSFIKELKKAKLNLVTKFDPKIDLVLMSNDTELTTAKMRTTCEILTKLDVKYYATNPDWVLPVDFGYIPDCGSMCFGYEKATGKTPIYIGKPSPLMINLVIDKFKVKKKDVVVIGDRIYTDIASGFNAKVDTILVLSGEASMKDFKQNKIKPTYLLNNIADLLK